MSQPTPTDAAPRPLTARRLAIVGAVEAVARGLPLAVYPLAQYRAWGDAATVSTIYLAVGILSLAMVLLVPQLTRRLPRRWTHSLAVLLYLVSAGFGMVGGRMTSVALLCAAFATAISMVCYQNNVLDHVDKADLGKFETRRLFYAGVGWTAGPFIGVWLLGQWHGAPFVGVAVAAVVMLALIWRFGMGSTVVVPQQGRV
ncbi:MAG: hypothetical protein ACKVQR_15260 [Aquabacterium sp.]